MLQLMTKSKETFSLLVISDMIPVSSCRITISTCIATCFAHCREYHHTLGLNGLNSYSHAWSTIFSIYPSLSCELTMRTWKLTYKLVENKFGFKNGG